MNSLNRKYAIDKENLEESRRKLIQNVFVGKHLHEKLQTNVHGMNEVTKKCTTMSATFENNQLQLKQNCAHLEELITGNMHENGDSRKLLQNMAFPQEDENHRKAFKTLRCRTLACIEDIESEHRKRENEEMLHRK